MYGYHVYPDQKITTRLSLAVSLVDDYTGKQPIGGVKVFLKEKEEDLKEKEIKSVKNRSGYYLFLDLPEEEYRVQVEAEHYFEEDIPVKLSDLDPLNPVVQIKLKPRPSYPFPSGTTLIRGMVSDTDKNPVAGAKVEVPEKNVINITTEKGEFVLYFKGLTDDNIKKEGGKRFVKVNSNTTVSLEAAWNSKKGSSDLEKVEEGQTTVLEEPIVLK
jgi:hypothetical protein